LYLLLKLSLSRAVVYQKEQLFIWISSFFALSPFIIVPPLYVWVLIDPGDPVFQHPMTSVGFLFSAIGLAVFIDTVGRWAFWSLFNWFLSRWSQESQPPDPPEQSTPRRLTGKLNV
jgi:hypothetical protein